MGSMRKIAAVFVVGGVVLPTAWLTLIDNPFSESRSPSVIISTAEAALTNEESGTATIVAQTPGEALPADMPAILPEVSSFLLEYEKSVAEAAMSPIPQKGPMILQFEAGFIGTVPADSVPGAAELLNEEAAATSEEPAPEMPLQALAMRTEGNEGGRKGGGGHGGGKKGGHDSDKGKGGGKKGGHGGPKGGKDHGKDHDKGKGKGGHGGCKHKCGGHEKPKKSHPTPPRTPRDKHEPPIRITTDSRECTCAKDVVVRWAASMGYGDTSEYREHVGQCRNIREAAVMYRIDLGRYCPTERPLPFHYGWMERDIMSKYPLNR